VAYVDNCKTWWLWLLGVGHKVTLPIGFLKRERCQASLGTEKESLVAMAWKAKHVSCFAWSHQSDSFLLQQNEAPPGNRPRRPEMDAEIED